MTEPDPTLWERLADARTWAHAKAQLFLSWLPDPLEPYAIDVAVAVFLLAAFVGMVRKAQDICRFLVSLIRMPRQWIAGPAPEPESVDEPVARVERKVDELRAIIEQGSESIATEAIDQRESAIDRAVAAAQEVLDSNDPSKAEAQAALRAGDIAAAEAALAAAFERESLDFAQLDDHAQQLRQKAARTAREKAALAATHSVKDAASWYRKAADLEPDDFWTSIELSRLFRTSGDLAAAHEAAGAAGRAASDDRERSVASNDLANVLRARGDLSGALKSYAASHEIFERLAGQDPGNARWQHDLSVSHEKIGDVLGAQDNLPGALKSYGASLEIRERLAGQDPGNADWQRDLSVSHVKIGDVLRARGDLSGALKSFGAGLEIRERLAGQDPGNAGWQYDLGIGHERIGNVLKSQGKRAEALEAYQTRHSIISRLAGQDPGNAGWQRDRASSLWNLAQIPESGVAWSAVAEAWEELEQRGILAPVDAKFVIEARRLADENSD